VRPTDNSLDIIEITKQILRLLRLGKIGNTEIMYALKLSHAQTQKYLPWLLRRGVIEQADDGSDQTVYGITQKGVRLLGQIEYVLDMLNPVLAGEIEEMPEYRVQEGISDQGSRHLGEGTRLRLPQD
jgi:predicted transcriptional regulator